MKASIAACTVVAITLAGVQTSARAEGDRLVDFKLPMAASLDGPKPIEIPSVSGAVPRTAASVGITVSPKPSLVFPMAEVSPNAEVEVQPILIAQAEPIKQRRPVQQTRGVGTIEQHVAKPNWSLPIAGMISTTVGAPPESDGENQGQSGGKKSRSYDASATVADVHNPVGSSLEGLTDKAWSSNDKNKALDAAVAHYRTKTQRLIASTKDTVDYVIPFRGFGMSSEAGDIILDEQVKVKSRGSAEYARQRSADELHLVVATNMLQMALGIGMTDRVRGEEASMIGCKSLAELVGAEAAEHTLTSLSNWSREVEVPASVFQQPVWDVTKKQESVKTIVAEAMQSDPVVDEITKRLHKYNKHSNFSRGASKVIQATLGAMSLTPDFVGPAAKAALVAYITATGGPESCKLLKELYLEKRYQSRWKSLNEQAHMAVENYQVALLTKNKPLMLCSESMVEHMSGRDTVKKVFGRAYATGVAPSIAVTSPSL